MSTAPDSPVPSELMMRTAWEPFRRRTDIALTQDGLSWKEKGRDPAWAPWHLVGGLSMRIVGKGTPMTDILALDGSTLGSIEGRFAVDGEVTTLPHIVALFRPDLFLEVDQSSWTVLAGCIRRDVVLAERAIDAP